MAFPPNYRQNRQDRARAKDEKSRKKEARREERRKQKPDDPTEQPPVDQTNGEKE